MKHEQKTTAHKPENNYEERALSLFKTGQYKDAIEYYKKLLQNADNSEWRRQLAECYLQRALAFSAKGMIKEALVLWENYSQQARPPYQYYDHYLIWLLQTGNAARIQAGLGKLTMQQLDQEYPALAALLGLLIITAHPEYAQVLPQDSVFVAQLKTVQTALQAHHPDEAEAALKQLPYRSVFRDFRTLFKASLLMPVSPTEAQTWLAKIPASSPYSQAAGLLLACMQRGAALAWAMAQFNHSQRRFVSEMTGLNKKQLELVESLSGQKNRLSDKAKFDLAIRYRALFGDEPVKNFCHALLVPYPAGQRDFKKNFGSLDVFEENRLKALEHELNNNSYDAEFYWQACIRELKHEQADSGDLKIALILRHLATKQPDEEKVHTLIESLEHDAGDRDTYLQIVDYFARQQNTTDAYNQWLSKTLDKFPQDVEVLTRATQSALRNRVYDKAGRYASSLLKIDPLNSFAKQSLFSSHLAHARQLLQGKKYHLAEQEIQRAEALKLGKGHAQQTELMRSLLCFAAQDKKQGLQAITHTLSQVNKDPINGCFQATMEALLSNLPVATLLRDLPPIADHLLSASELSRFIELLTYYGQEDINRSSLHKSIGKIKANLKTSIQQQSYPESLLLSLCEALVGIGHFELLRHCTKSAQAKWQKPIWMYYRVYAETNGKAEQCSFMHRFHLEYHLDQARDEKDQRASVLIGNYLDRYYEAHPPEGMGFLEQLLNQAEQDGAEAEDPFDALFGHVPDEIFDKINKKLESLTKKMSPERLIQELFKITTSSQDLLFAIMQNPDLFTALMILKAANELGINIDVSVEAVLDCFGVTTKTNPSSRHGH